MSSSFASFLDAQFNAPTPKPELNLIKFLKAQYPQSHHLTVSDCFEGQFPLSGYLATIGIHPSVVEQDTHSVVNYNSESKDVYSQVIAGVTDFTYDSTRFRAFKASWVLMNQPHVVYHLVFDGDNDAVGQKLIKAVYTWVHELKGEIWVFEGGQWSKNKQLYKAVQSSSWDDIVLDDKFKDGLRRDTQTFFASQDVYESLGITWKRGILLLGPPGNGKTESIKALLQETKGIAPLYVKSFTTRMGPEQGIQMIFQHARSHSPCILILEDLDSMVTPQARSFFLNELDGLAHNSGILTIATTNHPERIDDAILNRPSRFDVKYDFTLPDSSLRREFATKWLTKVNAMSANTGIKIEKPDDVASAIAERTEGWSFAFLKELFVSFLLRMAHDKSLRKSGVDVFTEPVDALMKQIDQLASQILKVKESATSDSGSGSADMQSFMPTRYIRATARDAAVVHSGVNF